MWPQPASEILAKELIEILEFVSVWMTFMRNKHRKKSPKLKQLIRNYIRLVHVAK